MHVEDVRSSLSDLCILLKHFTKQIIKESKQDHQALLGNTTEVCTALRAPLVQA